MAVFDALVILSSCDTKPGCLQKLVMHLRARSRIVLHLVLLSAISIADLQVSTDPDSEMRHYSSQNKQQFRPELGQFMKLAFWLSGPRQSMYCQSQ